MPLNIETFSNAVGGNAFYKAITHPLVAAAANTLVAELRAAGRIAVYDPHTLLPAFDALYRLDKVELAGLFVQNVEQVGRKFRDLAAQPVTSLSASSCDALLVADFDADQTIEHLRRHLPREMPIIGFDRLRLPADMLSNRKAYLSNLNFATNFVFFREQDGQHTRLVTVNYWANYGSKGGCIWFMLFDHAGKEIAQWRETLPAANGAITVDSAEVRRRFSLPAFTGQLFMHVVGAAGHDIVKYALDTYGDDAEILSCTHDANSWPADRYAGLPAPERGDDVVLWVQNSHPTPIPSGEIALNLMGDARAVPLNEVVAPYATRALHVTDLLPDAVWPQQIEIRAGKHMVRPRYEVIQRSGRRNIAHPNVERSDLKLDHELPKLRALLGKGFILPAPILPPDRYRSLVLPTPMSTVQNHLPVKLLAYDSSGQKIAERSFGNLSRKQSVAFDLADVLGNQPLPGGYGHMELLYDFDAGTDVDGWMHALFRFVDRTTQHQAETSFGAHIFNTLATYKNEPQSYKGPPPGLTTRLFLRLGPPPHRTLCHLIYPASLPWNETSDTALVLMSGDGSEVARRQIRIACGGSLLWCADEMFGADDLKQAGDGAHIVVRDTTCRLFGYHGLVGAAAFSLDHMFGF